MDAVLAYSDPCLLPNYLQANVDRIDIQRLRTLGPSAGNQ